MYNNNVSITTKRWTEDKKAQGKPSDGGQMMKDRITNSSKKKSTSTD